MKWTLVFCMITAYYLVVTWNFCDRVFNHGESCVFRFPDPKDEGTKGYEPMVSWNETPPARRFGWIMKYTLVYMYFMMVTDITGAIGCYVARFQMGHQRWFTVFVCLCAFLYVARVIAAIPEWQTKYPFLLFPPTIGAMLIFPLLFYEKLFPTLPTQAKADCDEHMQIK